MRYSISNLSDDFDEVIAYNNNFFAVRLGCKWGLVSNEGCLVLQCIYDWIWNIQNERVIIRYKGKKSYIPLTLHPVLEKPPLRKPLSHCLDGRYSL